jgi:TolA-binding protein
MADLSSVTALITAAGSVIGLANKANTVEANQKIIELQQHISQVQQTVSELVQENQELKDENRKLKDELNTEELYPLRDGARWKKSPDGTENDGPFCPVCFANKKLLMPLRFRSSTTTPGLLSFMCPEPHNPPPPLGRDFTYKIEEASIKKGRYKIAE